MAIFHCTTKKLKTLPQESGKTQSEVDLLLWWRVSEVQCWSRQTAGTGRDRVLTATALRHESGEGKHCLSEPIPPLAPEDGETEFVIEN